MLPICCCRCSKMAQAKCIYLSSRQSRQSLFDSWLTDLLVKWWNVNWVVAISSCWKLNEWNEKKNLHQSRLKSSHQAFNLWCMCCVSMDVIPSISVTRSLSLWARLPHEYARCQRSQGKNKWETSVKMLNDLMIDICLPIKSSFSWNGLRHRPNDWMDFGASVRQCSRKLYWAFTFRHNKQTAKLLSPRVWVCLCLCALST